MKKADNPQLNDRELYHTLLGDKAAYIYGKDFQALNYGKDYAKLSNGGKILIRISGGERSFEFSGYGEEIPNNVFFDSKPPYIRLTESSHITNLESFYTQFSLDQLVESLQKNGVKFK